MANSFKLTKKYLLTSALRKIGALETGEEPGDLEYQEASDAFNLLLLFLQTYGVDIWATEEVTKTFSAGELNVQSFTPSTGTLTVESAFIRDTTGNTTDSDLYLFNEREWGLQSNKADTTNVGKPTGLYFDKKLSPTIYLLPHLNSTNYAVHYLRTVELDDMTEDETELTMPKYWGRAIIYLIADDLADEYGSMEPADRRRLELKARQIKEETRGAPIAKEKGDKYVKPLQANL